MINYQMQPFSLYVKEDDVDIYGRNIGKWVFVENILVALNFISMSGMNEDIRYKDCDYSGLTRYKDFIPGNEYKIIATATAVEYRVHSFNTLTPFSQLVLQVVL